MTNTGVVKFQRLVLSGLVNSKDVNTQVIFSCYNLKLIRTWENNSLACEMSGSTFFSPVRPFFRYQLIILE